ncbi:hypothetical protein [Streptomyces sp. NPDC042319]|uniref:hypothetical protein n=1 Tax=Streptomyces sp. NPDC042319 TaxID=3154332 RepID=UPI0033E5A2C4
MTRLPGTSLRGTRLDTVRTAAVATAVTRLHEALPRHVLTAVPPRSSYTAEITEHISVWGDGHLPADALLAHFDLTPAETARLRTARRLLTAVWLFLLRQDARSAHPRNPPDVLARQAARVLDRLG